MDTAESVVVALVRNGLAVANFSRRQQLNSNLSIGARVSNLGGTLHLKSKLGRVKNRGRRIGAIGQRHKVGQVF